MEYRVTRTDEYLAHHGILGMRWGVRKKEETSDRSGFQAQTQKPKRKKTKDEINRERTKKILIGLAGAAVTGATVAALVKYHKFSADQIIKSGQTLQNIAMDSADDVGRNFYAALNDADKLKYKGIYGNTLNGKAKALNMLENNNSVFNRSIDTVKDVKIASRKNAQKEFHSFLNNNPQSASEIQEMVDTYKNNIFVSPRQKAVFNRASSDFAKNKHTKNTYEAYNILLVDHSQQNESIKEHFFKQLKEKGYDGIQDINDMKYSGYNSKNPVILFGGNKSKLKVSRVNKIPDVEIEVAYARAQQKLMHEENVKMYELYGGVFGGTVGASVAAKQYQKKY